MTQEEKAKAYDEAIDKVAHFIKKHIGLGCMIHPNSSEAKELFNIFPELKESEEENIRKGIIGFLKTIASLKDGKTVSNEDFDSIALLEWAAWLEKQDKQKPAWSEEDDECINNMLYILNQLKYTTLYTEDNTVENLIYWLNTLKNRICQRVELSNYDKDMMGAIEYCIKNKRPLEKEHITWLKNTERR